MVVAFDRQNLTARIREAPANLQAADAVTCRVRGRPGRKAEIESNSFGLTKTVKLPLDGSVTMSMNPSPAVRPFH